MKALVVKGMLSVDDLSKLVNELLEVGCMAWNDLVKQNDLIKSLCHTTWATYENTS